MAKDWLNRSVLMAPHFVLCTNEEDFIKKTKNIGSYNQSSWIGENSGASMHTFFKVSQGRTCIVCIEIIPGRPYEEVAAYLAHEAVHVSQELFDSIGEDNPGRETQAYAVQNILWELLLSYKKQSEKAVEGLKK